MKMNSSELTRMIAEVMPETCNDKETIRKLFSEISQIRGDSVLRKVLEGLAQKDEKVYHLEYNEIRRENYDIRASSEEEAKMLFSQYYQRGLLRDPAVVGADLQVTGCGEKTYEVCVPKYGYAEVKAHSEEEALRKTDEMWDDEFDWAERDWRDAEIVNED